MLKSALKNNKEFIKILHGNHRNTLNDPYMRYINKIKKINDKREER